MVIIPAIDIYGGKCVRLTQGDFKTAKVYSGDPLAMAKKFAAQGAGLLHVVDLDGAKTGIPKNQNLILKIIKEMPLPVEVGGGIRNYKTAKTYLDAGAKRIVLGTQAFENPEMVLSLIQNFGSLRIVVALELKNGRVAISGWQQTLDKNYLDFAEDLEKFGVTEILFTDVDKDGSLTKPNFGAAEKLIQMGFNVTASGGISDLESVKELKTIGAWGAILGKAIYENKISLTDALRAAKPVSNLTKRIIPCLDVKDGRVVKGIKFRGHKVLGDIVGLASRYCQDGADELVFYDITASTENRTVSADWVRQVAEVIDIPFCVAGGIRSVEDARKVLQNGADKISVNSPALENPDLINQLAKEFGSQCVVVGVDSLELGGDYFVQQYAGNPEKIKQTKWRTADWVAEAQKRGAGEIVLNCMNQDGVKRGYDLKQLKQLRDIIGVPLVASGGAGSPDDFRDVFLAANVDAALAASVFHGGKIVISELKNFLSTSNIPMRL